METMYFHDPKVKEEYLAFEVWGKTLCSIFEDICFQKAIEVTVISVDSSNKLIWLGIQKSIEPNECLAICEELNGLIRRYDEVITCTPYDLDVGLFAIYVTGIGDYLIN